jgi:site-specific recombinase XerD
MKLKEFQEHVDEFLTHLQVERNLSEHTIRAYTLDLKNFIIFWKHLLQSEH